MIEISMVYKQIRTKWQETCHSWSALLKFKNACRSSPPLPHPCWSFVSNFHRSSTPFQPAGF